MKRELKSTITVTDPIREAVHEKLFDKFDKFDGYIKEVTVKLTVANNVHETTILLLMKGQNRATKVSAKSDDLYKSIDLVSEKALRKVKQIKEKEEHARKKLGFDIDSFNSVSVDSPIEEGAYEIAKIKKFTMPPIYVEEAIVEMNKLGHDFFFYFDASANIPCVVYKRKDGDYGIIESDF